MRIKLAVKLLLVIAFSLFISLIVVFFPSSLMTKYIIYNQGNISVLYYNIISLLIFLTGSAVFIASFLAISRKKIKYIEYMARRIKEIAEGDLGSTIDVRGKDEIADLALNINTMSKELKVKFDHERELEKQKNELITNISHDLRTPLTSLNGFLKLVKDNKNLDEQSQMEYVNIAYEKSEQLKNLMEELFELTKLSGKGYKLNRVNINIKDMLKQLIIEMEPIATEKQLEIINEFSKGKWIVNLDPNLFIRVLDNLLSNAIKYSDKPGLIYIKLETKEDHIIISFRNKGKTIPKEELSKVFERFYKLDKSRSNDTSTGLGLAIARDIVNLHGGEIWADSVDEYIIFNIKIPIA